MAQPTRLGAARRERPHRTETEPRIRAAAQALLVEHGESAVTLRAIARELGITAPALYRYYPSREALLHKVGQDICEDLAAQLDERRRETAGADPVRQFLEVCRGFRRWALAHPQEYVLVFASAFSSAGARHEQLEQTFGSVMMTAACEVLTSKQIAAPSDADVPAGLHEPVEQFRRWMLRGFERKGLAVGTDFVGIGLAHFMLQFWTRLYGHVTLEVFGTFPAPTPFSETLFEGMLTELIGQVIR
jgi:AcrR family transcriptional regulator